MAGVRELDGRVMLAEVAVVEVVIVVDGPALQRYEDGVVDQEADAVEDDAPDATLPVPEAAPIADTP